MLSNKSQHCITLFLLIISQICVPKSLAAQSNNFSINKQLPSWLVKISDQHLKLKAKDITDGYYLSLYENQNHVELAEDYTHVNREISSDAGVQNGSQISVTYDPSFQKLIFHSVILWRNGKKYDQLQPGKFKVLQNEKDLSKFIYSGTFDAYLLLEDIRKGDKIEYAYTIKGSNPIFGPKISTSYYLEDSSVMAQLYVNLIANRDRDLMFKNFNHKVPAKVIEKGNLKIYEWTASSTQTHRIAKHEPSWYNPMKRVQITEYKTWNEIVNWGITVNRHSKEFTPTVKKKILELKKLSAGDTYKYICLAKRFVQDEIRYMGIEIGIYSQRPNAPEKVLIQRYGDCKDKSLLLISLLEGAGVTAYMTYANTNTTIKTNESVPSPFAFNHVIVRLDYQGKQKWIDPTISGQRGNFDEFYAPDYGYVLVLKPGTNTLQKMPQFSVGKLVSHSVFHIADTTTSAMSKLTVKSTYSGHYADEMRSTIAESGSEDLDKDYVEYYNRYYTDVATNTPLVVHDDEAKNIVVITESYNIPDIWNKEDDSQKQYINIYGDLIRQAIREIPAKKRPEPIALNHPISIEQHITVNMPYTYQSFSDEKSLNTKNFKFDFSTTLEGNKATYDYKFQSVRDYIESSEIKAYRKDFEAINMELQYYLNALSEDMSAANDLNKFALLICVITLAIGALYFVNLYRQSGNFDIGAIDTARPIRGWLLAVGLRVLLGPIVIINHAVQLELFSNRLWARLINEGSLSSYAFLAIYGFLLIALPLLLLYAITSVVLFFNKRTTFPKLYVRFTYFIISLSIMVSFLKIVDKQILENGLATQIIATVMSVLGSVVLILYLKKSTRVRETFVFTYPGKDWRIALINYYNKKLTTEDKLEQSTSSSPSTKLETYENL